jgi:FixJ family two-component response regulator
VPDTIVPEANSTAVMVRQNNREMANPTTRVAIVDDDPSVLKALARLVAACSFAPQTYGSAREFLDSLPQGWPDCLVIDLQMPEMNALELQHQLSRAAIKIPTIIITAHNDPRFQQECEAAGVAAYLLKPLDERTLISAINSATGRA